MNTAATLRGSIRHAVTFAKDDSMIQIHEDSPAPVRKIFEDTGITALRFQSIDPSISEVVTPNYENLSPLGRSESYYSYSGSSNREIALTLHFVSSVRQADQGEYDNAMRHVRFLQSLLMPTYAQGGIMYPPPLCRLVLGRFINARGIVTVASPTYPGVFGGKDSPFDYPILADVQFNFVCLNVNPLQARDYLRAAAQGGNMDPSARQYV